LPRRKLNPEEPTEERRWTAEEIAEVSLILTLSDLKGTRLIGELIYQEALPFALVESVSFQKVIAFFAPGFRVPSRQTMSGSSLQASYATTKAEVDKKLQEQKVVTLGCDGSSDGCQDPITHIIAITGDQTTFLLREVAHLEEEHSAENITLELDKDIASLATVSTLVSPLTVIQLGVKVRGLISDNEAKMKSVREQFKADHTDPLAHIVSCPGDPPHALQLVVKV
jgi:nucleoside diphosphate kinase